MILHKNKQIFAGQLTGQVKPVLLQEFDIILLSLFLAGCDLLTATQQFQTNPLVKALLPSVPANAVSQRVQHFIQSGLLCSVKPEYKKSTIEIRKPEIIEKQFQFSNQGTIRIITNFALIPTADGFKSWSPINNEYYQFNLELLLTLLLFVKFNNVGEAIANKPVYLSDDLFRKNIYWLIENRFLLLEDEKLDVESSNDLSNHKSTEKKTIKPVQNSWKEIIKDERIPIYFVPHMENHFPLALGLIYSSIESYNNGELLKTFQLVPIVYLEPEEFINGPYRKFGKGVWLFSNYLWSIDTNIQFSNFVKQHSTGNLTIHGGPSSPDYKQECIDFFKHNPSVDMSVHGEGEIAIRGILKSLYRNEKGDILFNNEYLNSVDGISYRNDGNQNDVITTTVQRTRMKVPDTIPSPYNLGYFDNYSNNVDAAIIESNRGCPFGCSFCDWGSAINQKVRKYDLARVKEEIEWIAKNNVKVLWIADANFGLYDRDIELATYIIKMKKQYNYPQEVVVNYTKNTTWRLAEIIKIFTEGGIISQGVISIQTMDERTLEVINRKNIKIDKYEELSQIFSEMNLPLSTDLMLGLPGITVEALKNDLQYYFNRDVSVKAYPTQLLPNSPMADPEYIQKYKIKTDNNNFLVSTFSYSSEELDAMKALYKTYTVADGYSLLRYVLRYLQWEHGLESMEVLWKINSIIKENPSSYPMIAFAINYFETDKCMPGGWREFYEQVAEFLYEYYNIERSSAFDVVLKVNEAAMPEETFDYPLSIDLDHDFESYFSQNRNRDDGDYIKLATYKPATLSFDDPEGMASMTSSDLQYDSHQFFWEIHSSLIRSKSVSNIANKTI